MRFAKSRPDPDRLPVFGNRHFDCPAVFIEAAQQLVGLGEVGLKLNRCFNLRPRLAKLASSENTLVTAQYQRFSGGRQRLCVGCSETATERRIEMPSFPSRRI